MLAASLAVFWSGCDTSPDQKNTESEAFTSESAPETHEGRALPTGGDYHSTSFRAQGRTMNKLDDIGSIRQEQKQAKLDFSGGQQ